MTVAQSHNGCNVHLWRYDLQDPVPEVSMDWFSDDDKSLIASRRSLKDRMQYIYVHAFLKNVLAMYTHQPPNQVQLVIGARGKPALKYSHPHPPFHFSLSYRQGYAVLAIANEASLGVDVEEISEVDSFDSFLDDYFSPDEEQQIRRAKTWEETLTLVYTLWTMKEAMVKALGKGVNDMRRYDVSPFLDIPLNVPGFDPGNYWIVEAIPAAKNYIAALAVRANKIHCTTLHYGRDSDVLFR